MLLKMVYNLKLMNCLFLEFPFNNLGLWLISGNYENQNSQLEEIIVLCIYFMSAMRLTQKRYYNRIRIHV